MDRTRSWWRRSRSGTLIALVDLAILLAAGGMLAYQAHADGRFVIMAAVASMISLAVAKMYRSRFTLSFLDDLPRLTAALIIGMVVAIWATRGLGWESRETLLPAAGLLLAAVLVGRSLSYFAVGQLRAHANFRAPVVILGAGEVGQEIGSAIAADATLGLELMGYVDDEPMYSGHSLSKPLLGGVDELPQVLERTHAAHLIVAFTAGTGRDLVSKIRTADRASAEVSVVPRLFELGFSHPAGDEINGVPLTRLNRKPFRASTWPLKRAVDIFLSGTALLLLSPILALIALVLRLTDGPGVLFHQERIGIDRVPFELLKFRSLKPATESESDTKWNVHNDDRMSKVGKFIRRTSIDELPQLFNILRGDMSLVGPRPERPHFVDAFGEMYPRYDERHRVPCGLTGWAQIHGLRGDTSISERARFDNYYIENWTLWLDFKIMFRTATRFMQGAG